MLGRATLDPTYGSAYLEDHPSAADEIGAFLMRPEVGARIEAAFFAVEDPRLRQILSDMAWEPEWA